MHQLTANGRRVQNVTYPANKVIYYDYGADGAIDDRLQRVAAIYETDAGETQLSGYDYNSVGRLAIADLPVPKVKFDYYQGTSGTYAGLDRFGRVKDQYWKGYGGTSDVDRFRYGHDYAGDRTWRDTAGGRDQDTKGAGVCC